MSEEEIKGREKKKRIVRWGRIAALFVITFAVCFGVFYALESLEEELEPTPMPEEGLAKEAEHKFQVAMIGIAVYSDTPLNGFVVEFVNFPEVDPQYTGRMFFCEHRICDLSFCRAEIHFDPDGITTTELYKWFSDNNITTIRFCPYGGSCTEREIKLRERRMPLVVWDDRCEALGSGYYGHFTHEAVFYYLNDVEGEANDE